MLVNEPFQTISNFEATSILVLPEVARVQQTCPGITALNCRFAFRQLCSRCLSSF
jgi:hypothetical protein